MRPTVTCKDCIAQGVTTVRPALHPGPRCATHHRAWLKRSRERGADRARAITFGLTGSTYRELLAIQGGVCAGCGRPPGKRRLAVDHDHACCPGPTSCGRCVRGLLCWSCNKHLQHMGDDAGLIRRLADYLENWPSFKMTDPDPEAVG